MLWVLASHTVSLGHTVLYMQPFAIGSMYYNRTCVLGCMHARAVKAKVQCNNVVFKWTAAVAPAAAGGWLGVAR